MKLRIHEKHPDMDAYKVGASFTPYAIIAVDKRFTDAELAAEYWAEEAKARSVRLTSRSIITQQRAATLQRFAQHAHFDKVKPGDLG